MLGGGALLAGCGRAGSLVRDEPADPAPDGGSLPSDGGGWGGADAEIPRASDGGARAEDAGIPSEDAGVAADAHVALGAWRYDAIGAPAGGRAWTCLLGHDTGEVTESVVAANWDREKNGTFPWRRVSIAPAPDGRPAFREELPAGYICEPIGLWSTIVPFDNDDARYVHLRYHEWTTGHTGQAGKRHLLYGGRSWVARGYEVSPGSNLSVSAALGSTDGWGVNMMRPVAGGENYLGTLGSHREQDSLFGSVAKDTSSPRTPTGRWVVYDVVADLGTASERGSYSAYMDGVLVSRQRGITPAQRDLSECRCLGWRIRNMIGGTPADLPNRDDHVRYSGGFFLCVA